MKLANIRGIEPQSVAWSGTRETPANSPGLAVRGAEPRLSEQPATRAMPINLARSGSHRFAGLAGALKNQPPALSQPGKPTGAPFTSRSAQSLPNSPAYPENKLSPMLAHRRHADDRVGHQQTPADQIASTAYLPRRSRLADLMHEERASEMTTQFLEKEKYPAPAQLSSSEISVLSPAVHLGAGSPAASVTSMSSAALKSEAPMADGGDDSVRWAADSQPTNLFWQKIETRQKEEIFDAFSERLDLAGITLWNGAEAGGIEAMDSLDNHLLMHYYKDEFGEANPLRFPPKVGEVVALETTPADIRADMDRVQPLVDAQREQRTNERPSQGIPLPGWLKSLFKRGDQ